MNANVATELQFLAEALPKRGRTVATAESVTAGRIQARLSALSGSSRFFVGGLCAYTIPIKVKLLKVDLEHALSVDAVSERVAVEMAHGAAALFGATFSIAITGYAETAPLVGIMEPQAYYAIFDSTLRKIVESGKFVLGPVNRNEAQEAFADQCVLTLASLLRST